GDGLVVPLLQQAEIGIDLERGLPHVAGKLADDVLLVGEMGIEGRTRRAGRLGDVVDRGAAGAVALEQLARGVDQPLAGEVPLLAAERDGIRLIHQAGNSPVENVILCLSAIFSNAMRASPLAKAGEL